MPSLLLSRSSQAGRLLVLLPGRGGSPRDFLDGSFPAIAARAGLPGDLLAVDAHFGYYAKKTVLERLREDVVLPARRRGVSSLWLVGVSLGGAGATLYADAYPGEIDGLVLLAPFLGRQPIHHEIREAGGLTEWRPGPPRSDDDFERRIWAFLRRNVIEGSPGVPVLLGFGDDDSSAAAHELLAAQLAEERVARRPGGHDWTTWSALWGDLAPKIDAIDRGQPP